jgi:hypothetical protein
MFVVVGGEFHGHVLVVVGGVLQGLLGGNGPPTLHVLQFLGFKEASEKGFLHGKAPIEGFRPYATRTKELLSAIS